MKMRWIWTVMCLIVVVCLLTSATGSQPITSYAAAPARPFVPMPQSITTAPLSQHAFHAAASPQAPRLSAAVVITHHAYMPSIAAPFSAPIIQPGVATDFASATSFLYSGTNALQVGVLSSTMTFTRVAVLRGRVLARNATELPGVTVTILDHPEYGHTATRADGLFDMAVNGGGPLTVIYQLSGYMTVQRQVIAPWRDYVWLPNIVMMPFDTAVTTVAISATSMQIARGSSISDTDGIRRATLLFPHGTTATMVLSDGTSLPLSTLQVRATEYTVGSSGPKAMPAALPSGSGYTYAAEFSIDQAIAAGAAEVRFNQTLPVYVENFLGFPVGTAVPTGYYDRQKGQWVASTNGLVIKILSITGGLADLDLDGTNTVANGSALSALGVSTDELTQLAQLYTPGQMLWRVPITHFTPWDCNWPYGPPPGATPPPGGPGGPRGPNRPKPDKPNKDCGSIIGCEDQTLGQALPIAGTSWSLHYVSSHAPGRKDSNSIVIPVTGATIPASMQAIHIDVSVAGQFYHQVISPTTNLTYTFTWNGADGYGRPVDGAQIAEIIVGFDYVPQYYAAKVDFINSFARMEAAGPAVSAQRSSNFVTLSRTWRMVVGAWNARPLGLGGWTLSIHHAYDPSFGALLLGDGTQRSAASLPLIITTAAGQDAAGFSGDGAPAVTAMLGNYGPSSVAAAPDGSLYIADNNNERIRVVAPSGIITTVAGNGSLAFGGDGGPALAASLYEPTAVAVGPDGSLYILDKSNARVRRVKPDSTASLAGGIITTVAGNGINGYSGDGGPAVNANLNSPYGIAVGSDGSLYIADSGNYRIRRVGTDGIITTVAGNGLIGYNGDGAPATTKRLNYPTSVAVAKDGSLYIADFLNNRIRRVAPDGIISTVGGTGAPGFSGDGGLAVLAQLYQPVGIATAPDGSVYVADSFNYRIRAISPDGLISTVAGVGTWAYDFTGEGGPALDAQLFGETNLTVGPDNSLYFPDNGHHRIFRVQPAMPGISLSDVVIPSEDGSEVYVFSQSGRHLKTVNAQTGTVVYLFGYDAAGYLASVTDGSGNVTTLERTGALLTAIVAAGGQRTTLAVNTSGWLVGATSPTGETHTMTYTASGLLQQFSDPLSNVHRFTYDADGRLIKDEDPVGGSITLSRVELSNGYTITTSSALAHNHSYMVEFLGDGTQRRTVTDPSGAASVMLEYTNGSQQMTYADGTVISVTYSPDPRWGMLAPRVLRLTRSAPGGPLETTSGQHKASLSDPSNLFSLQKSTDSVIINGRAFTRTFDAVTRVMTDTSAEGRQLLYRLDNQGRIIQEVMAPDQLGAPITVTYDSLGRVVEDHQGDQFWIMGYDAHSRVITRTDAAGRQVTFGYDPNDRIVTQTMPSGAALHYTYNANGNRTAVILPSGAPHTLQYTALDMDAAYTPPGNASYARAYNPDRQLVQTTLPSGRAITQSYDAAGRVSSLSDLDAMTSFTYLTSGPGDRVARIIHTPASGLAQDTVYTYTGNLISGIIISGTTLAQITYTYNNNLNVTGMDLTSAGDSLHTTMTHDRDGLLTGFGPFTLTPGGPGGALSQVGDGALSTSYGFDALARIITRTHQVNGQPVYAMRLAYNTIGQLISRTETVSGTTTLTYTYDLDGQLTQVSRDGNVSEQYGYDVNGNRTSQQLDGGAATLATYDSQDRLHQHGAVAYLFDADGFLSQRGADTFHYNARGQLVQAVIASQTITYSYDGLGRRVSREDNTGTTQYLYGDPSSILVTAMRAPTGEFSALYYDTAGLLIAIERGGTRYYVATDQVGTPRVVTNDSGVIVKVLAVDSFGRILTDTNPAFTLPLGYAGGLADAVSGLVHFGRRDYDVTSGRWTARDPALFAAGQDNLYVYVGNNPISQRDPSGLLCLNVTLYDGIGGGAQTCIGREGVSVCLEVGFGLGGGASLDTDGIAKEGGKVGLELSGKCGPVSMGGEITLDTGGCLNYGPIAQVGPLKGKDGKNEFKPSVWGDLPSMKLDAKCTASGKLYGRVCHQEKW